MTIHDLKVGMTVRGVFLEDEPVLIDGTKNNRYGEAVPFIGRIHMLHRDLPGGPYVEVSDQHNVYLCDVHEILEIL